MYIMLIKYCIYYWAYHITSSFQFTRCINFLQVMAAFSKAVLLVFFLVRKYNVTIMQSFHRQISPKRIRSVEC